MKGWIVARTQLNREAWAAENVLRQLAEPYLPKFAARVKVGQHYELKPKLLFPTYIFVRVLDGQWRFLLGTYGISIVMLVGNTPGMVLNSEIAKMKALEDADGLIQLPSPDQRRFKKGSAVRVSGGNLEGMVGIYDGVGTKDRERILMDYLGRKVSVLIPSAQLEAE